MTPRPPTNVSRRDTMRLLGLGSLSAFLGGSLGARTATAQSVAPAATSPSENLQGAGFYRVPMGQANVTLVSDGGFVMKPGEIFPEVPKRELEEATKAAHISMEGYPGQVNVVLIQNGRDVILIDTGAGRNFGPTAGHLVPNLARAGVRPGDVTHVILSHAHPDHVGGLLTPDGRRRFNNAKVYVNRAEHAFWTGENPTMPGSLVPPEMIKMAIGVARDAFAGVRDSIELVKPDDTVAGIVKVIDARGHTPGHVALRVGAAEERHLLFLGDALFIPALQLKHPDWHGLYDADPVLAAQARRKLFDRAADQGSIACGAHAPFPAVGYIDAEAGAYRWTPQAWWWGEPQ